MFRTYAGLIAVVVLIAGCGGSSKSSSSGGRSTGGSSPGALSADAKSAATGDIPDNQNFLTFKDSKDGFSMKYPEGWAQKRTNGGITFQDKNNLVRAGVSSGPAPTVASVTAELSKLKAREPSLAAKTPAKVTIKGQPVIKVTYTTTSTPNQVTGKRVVLLVDRYEYSKNGKVAVLDLGTPKGVDNVDAYRMMSESFQWL
jgi:photosystem II reaction center protein PsbP